VTEPATERQVVANDRREPKASGGRRWIGTVTEPATERQVVANDRREPKASGGRRWGWGPSAK